MAPVGAAVGGGETRAKRSVLSSILVLIYRFVKKKNRLL